MRQRGPRCGLSVLDVVRVGRRRPFGRGQGLHRQRVDLGPHPVAQRGVNALVPKHPTLAGELGRDDGGKKVMAIAFDLEVVARQSSGDEATHVVSSWVSHTLDYLSSKYGFAALLDPIGAAGLRAPRGTGGAAGRRITP